MVDAGIKEHQLWSTLVLNAFPLTICLYITFFGRFFDDLLRMVSIFFIVVFPIGAEALKPWLQGEALTFASLSVSDATTLVWAVVAGCTAMYTGARRRGFGIKMQLIGVAFAAVMTFNSYFIGLLHQTVNETLPGVSQWFDWFNFLFVVMASVVLMWARALPVAGEIVASAVCASIGGFMTLQQLTYIGRDLRWDLTDGLELKKLLNEEFGCRPKAYGRCVSLMTVMIIVTAVGAVTQHIMYQHHVAVQKGKHSIISFGIAKLLYNKVDSSMETLANVNQVIANMAKGLSGDEQRKQEIELQRDLYKVMGIMVDVVLVVYSLGLGVHMAEMAWKGVFSDAGTSEFVSFVFFTLTVLCLMVAGAAMAIRFAKEDIGSPPWQAKSTKYLMFVAVVWPILLFSYVFSGVIGGEEIALLDVPFINHAAGFAMLPLGCDSIVDDSATEPAFCAWAGGQAGVGTTNLWIEPEYLTPGGNHTVRIDEHGSPSQTATVATADGCAEAAAVYATYSNHDITGATWGLPEGGESTRRTCYAVWGSDLRFAGAVPLTQAPVPGVSTWQTCSLPADKMTEIALTVARRCSDGMMNYAEKGVDCGGACAQQCGACQCAYNGKSGAVNIPFSAANGNMCGTHLNGTNGVVDMVYVCYVHEPNSCTSPDSDSYEHEVTEYEQQGAEWVFCSPSVNEIVGIDDCRDSGSTPASAADVAIRQEVWFCEGPVCYACDTEECLVDKCAIFQVLKAYFPTTVRILFAIVVAAMLSMLTISGQLGGFYLFATRFTMYITSLNLIQGIALLVFGGIMEFRALPDNLEEEGKKTIDSLVEGEASIYRVVILGGILLVVQSLVGLLGVCFEDKKVGGGCLRIYLMSVLGTLLLFIVIFGGACYYILNIDVLIDRDWDLISYKLREGNNETSIDVLNGITRISKEEFVAYAKGLFRMVYIIGMWFVGYTAVLFAVTRYTVNMRTSAEAEHARKQKKMNNPMFEADDLNSPLSAAGAVAGVAGAVAGAATLGVVDKALDVVDAGLGVAEGAGGMVVEGADSLNPVDLKGIANAED